MTEPILDAWEVEDPHRVIRFHGARQKWAWQQMARCMESRFVRFFHGTDQLPAYQAVQADAFQKMSALREVLDDARRHARSAAKWRPLAELPERRAAHINVRTPDGLTQSYRWLPYRKGSQPPYDKLGGRWQAATEHGWKNAALPEAGEWAPNPRRSVG